ncbi:MAG: hypothetical protein M1823_004117 [Watsoniomyces obsoletus]|nr:MAG: hypothetical protein M1823_004117 [Watsoniomyces obsoletus]
MLTFRRALLAGAFILTCVYLLRSPSNVAAPLPTTTTKTTTEKSLQPASSQPDSAPKEQTTGRTAHNPTSAWRSKRPKRPSQQTLSNPGAGSLRDQLEYQFPYDVEGKFPGYVWQTWKDTPASGSFAEDLRPKEASWTELHPGFVHEVITDAAAIPLMQHLYASVPLVLEAYHALPLPILKADFFRYLILLARGGIYSDIDTTALRPAYDWVPEAVPRSSFGLVIGIEADPDREDWAKWYSRRVQFCQWTIQAKSGHPVLVDVVATITEETLKRKKEGTLGTTLDGSGNLGGQSVVEFTGPARWTDKIYQYFNDDRYFDPQPGLGNITWANFTGITEPKQVGDVVVLPITSFSPGVGQMDAGDVDDPMAFVKHEFQGIWKPESERHIGEQPQTD